MAKAKKLPSGNYRVQATRTVNGKRTVKSFTADSPAQAERLARDWQKHIDMIGDDSTTLTVEKAIEEYINMKSNILSASTISGYRQYLRNGFKDIKHLKLYQLTSINIQKSINSCSATLSPKTIKNHYGLLLATLKLFYPELTVSLTFPQKQKQQKRQFTKDYIKKLIIAIENTSIEIPALLAMTLSCRASEVAGLKWSDIDFKNKTIHIQRAKVYTDNGYILQNKTKNITSNRIIAIPDILFKKLLNEKEKSNSEFITTISPNQYCKHLKKATSKANIENINFHSLRHITASIMLDLGINNQVAQEIGGWATDNIMKSVYQHTFSESRENANKSLNNYFNKLSSKENKSAENHTKNHTKSRKRFKIKRFV